MRRAQVYKAANGSWVLIIRERGKFPQALTSDTWDEAMFLAQLLVDPHEYVRAVGEVAWRDGHRAGRIQEYFRIPGKPNPNRREDKTNDEHDA